MEKTSLIIYFLVSLIPFIIFCVMAYRLRVIKEKQQDLAAIEILRALNDGIINKIQCPKCKTPFIKELVQKKSKCKKCGFNLSKGNTILINHKGNLCSKNPFDMKYYSNKYKEGYKVLIEL